MKNNLEIKEYDYNNRKEFIEMKKNFKNIPEFSYLTITTLSEKNFKKIFLIVEHGKIIKNKIIAYAIIYDDMKLTNEANQISSEYIGTNSIFIVDFMVKKNKKRKGFGKKLANYIINESYSGKNILLQPQGEGGVFWKKFGFVKDNISTKNTWILKRN